MVLLQVGLESYFRWDYHGKDYLHRVWYWVLFHLDLSIEISHFVPSIYFGVVLTFELVGPKLMSEQKLSVVGILSWILVVNFPGHIAKVC